MVTSLLGERDYLSASKLYGEVCGRRPRLHQAVAIAPCTMNLVRGRRLRWGECPCIELKPELLVR